MTASCFLGFFGKGPIVPSVRNYDPPNDCKSIALDGAFCPLKALYITYPHLRNPEGC